MNWPTRLVLVCLSATNVAAQTTPAPPPGASIQVKTRQSQNGTTSGGASIHSKSKTLGAATERARTADDFGRDVLAASKAIQLSESVGKGSFKQVTETTGEFKSSVPIQARSTARTAGEGTTTGSAVTVGDSATKALFSGFATRSLNTTDTKLDAKLNVLQGASVNQHGGSLRHGSFRFNNDAVTSVNRSQPIPKGQTTAALVSQEGGTRGGGVLAGNGTASSAGQAAVDIRRPRKVETIDVQLAGRSDATAGSLAAAGGQFQQTAGSRSDVAVSGRGATDLDSRAATAGAGSTRGDAHIQQEAGAKGVGRALVDRSTGGVNDSLAVKVKAAENHGASSSFHGRFKINTTAETGFKRD